MYKYVQSYIPPARFVVIHATFRLYTNNQNTIVYTSNLHQNILTANTVTPTRKLQHVKRRPDLQEIADKI